ncbi:hypothetical protein O0I10_000077 [Lichtheimia ornata]|uniref:Nudix hydrolase domain-containing protein n=1 Tax=Lichtheimia ornata TaxID=688661 RepID=A0AAD7Y4S3_9FUNG|nr:uncharacterized protein O0I10_000077 [Lichtheimia ornata]KAJ8663803.1 hypothetical protein O0I10_000077 [Lichtheimia ornata]
MSDSPLDINTTGTAATIVSESKLHKRYISVWNRTTRFADGREIDWDVVGHDTPYPTFVTVFTFDSIKKTTCILKEYAQGTNEVKYTCVAGSYDRRKHSSPLESAEHELSEEARLKGGRWICLLPEDQPDGISELKWGVNRFVPYLCLDPEDDPEPRARDNEECMQVIKDVPIADLKKFITLGQAMLPTVQTAWMALEYLATHRMLN